MNRQINVLIVDDEAYVREGLRHILDWEALGFYICDEAAGGQEALEKIRLYQPDLVLLDIKMPGMSGTELIRIVREENYQGEIIVLSGHTDFKYAQTCLYYGAVNYIVKPIEEEEMERAVMTVKKKIEQLQDKERSTIQYRKKAKAMVLHDILMGQETDSYINYQELKLDASLYQVIIYESYLPHIQIENFAEILMIKEQQELYIEQIRVQNHDVILLKNRFALEKFQHWINKYKREYQKGSFMDSVFFVYGEPVSDIRKIAQTFQQCLRLIERKFYCDSDQHMLSWKDLSGNGFKTKIDEEVSGLFVERIVACLQSHNRQKLEHMMDELKQYLVRNDFKIAAVRHLLIDIFVEIKNSMIHNYGNCVRIPLAKNAEVIEFIENADYLFEIIRYFQEQYEIIMSCVGRDSPDNMFEEILAYIEKHYDTPLKLDTIGPIFGYSSSYLGKLFALKCGCSFRAWLEQVRIEKAKELLLNTDMKIFEISRKVGYKYVDVFHQKFKKQVAMSPAEFRRTYMKETDL